MTYTTKERLESGTAMTPYHAASNGASSAHDMVIEVIGGLQKVAHENRDPFQE